ncbi:MAG: restriction endonuclease subunit S [Oscillospiraceae bacterium]
MARGRKKETLTPEERLQAALVPENWCWVRLGLLLQSSKEKTDEFSDANLKYVGLEHMQKDTGIVAYDSATGVKSLKNVFHPQQILYGKLRPYLNKHDVATFDGVCSTDILVFNATSLCTPEFLNFFLDQDTFIEYAVSNSKGINLPRISESAVLNAKCPLPPLTEQQRIVDRIESLFAKLDEAKQKAQDALDSFETRKAAILHKAFTGELTERWRKKHGVGMESWETRTSTQLFEYVTSGSRGWAKYYADNGDIFIRMGNLDHGTIELDLSDIQRVNLPTQTEGQRTKLQKNDILISITADIGMVGLVREIKQNAYINQHIALARPTATDDAEFLAWYLVSDVGLQQMRNKQRGATKIGLGLDDIRSLELLIPMREEQAEVVQILDDLLAKEQQAREAAEGVLEQIDLIKKAILARAFRGELGTNDPGEESAVEFIKSVLEVEPNPFQFQEKLKKS